MGWLINHRSIRVGGSRIFFLMGCLATHHHMASSHSPVGYSLLCNSSDSFSPLVHITSHPSAGGRSRSSCRRYPFRTSLLAEVETPNALITSVITDAGDHPLVSFPKLFLVHLMILCIRQHELWRTEGKIGMFVVLPVDEHDSIG